MGGGIIDANGEKCMCSHDKITALIKKIFLFDTGLVVTNT